MVPPAAYLVEREYPVTISVRCTAVNRSRRCGCLLARIDSGVANESSSHVQIGDDDVHPSASQRGPDGGELALAARDTDPAWHSEQLRWADTDDSLVKLGRDQHPVFVEEPETYVAHGAVSPQFVLLSFGERVAAAAEEW